MFTGLILVLRFQWSWLPSLLTECPNWANIRHLGGCYLGKFCLKFGLLLHWRRRLLKFDQRWIVLYFLIFQEKHPVTRAANHDFPRVFKIHFPSFSVFKICTKTQRMFSSKRSSQMVYFLAKNPNLGKFWRVLQWKMLVYFMAIWYILWHFGIFCGHLAYFHSFGIESQQKIWQPWKWVFS
jgi:hypothetical protein